MAFEIEYSDEAKKNLDAITPWLLCERLAGETALRWLEGLREKIDTLVVGSRSNLCPDCPHSDNPRIEQSPRNMISPSKKCICR